MLILFVLLNRMAQKKIKMSMGCQNVNIGLVKVYIWQCTWRYKKLNLQIYFQKQIYHNKALKLVFPLKPLFWIYEKWEWKSITE